MKKIIIIAFVICALNKISKANVNFATNFFTVVDTLPSGSLEVFLQQVDLSSYHGKPVDSFLIAVPAIPYEMKVYGGSNSQGAHFRASYLWYKYSNGSVVRIYVREYIYLNRYSPTATWDVSLFRKEKVNRIEIFGAQGNCINGSCMN